MQYSVSNSTHWIAIGLIFLAILPLHAAKKSRIKPGDKAPEFALQGDDGKTYKLSDFNDQKVVVYFYPKDNSPYCTKQACSLAKGYAPYRKHNIKVFGINHQSPKTHAQFKEKHNLPFTLLSDPSSEVAKAYGAYSPLFIKRITILIDNGKIVKVLRSINVNNHANQILKAFGF